MLNIVVLFDTLQRALSDEGYFVYFFLKFEIENQITNWKLKSAELEASVVVGDKNASAPAIRIIYRSIDCLFVVMKLIRFDSINIAASSSSVASCSTSPLAKSSPSTTSKSSAAAAAATPTLAQAAKSMREHVRRVFVKKETNGMQ